MTFLLTKSKSHSTWALKVSANSVLQMFAGPGLAHSLQTRQVCTISGMSLITLSATPTRSRKRCMVWCDACHHRTCSFLSESRMALTRLVLKSRTTLPMSKLVQSSGRSGFTPASLNARRSRGCWSGPRARRAESSPPVSAEWLSPGAADDDELPVLAERAAVALSIAAMSSSPSAPSSSPSSVPGA